MDSSVVYNESEKELVIFAVNRHMEEAVETVLNIGGFEIESVLEHKVLNHADMKATNSADAPENVVPHDVCSSADVITLEPHSYNMIRIKVK